MAILRAVSKAIAGATSPDELFPRVCDAAIFGGGYHTNLRDVTSGTNGSCGTKCTAGSGYDLVTGLGSPINYP